MIGMLWQGISYTITKDGPIVRMNISVIFAKRSLVALHTWTSTLMLSILISHTNALCGYQWKLRRQKFKKVKIYFMHIFEQKLVISFLKGKKLPIFCHKYFFKWKMWKNWHFRPKKWKGWSHNLETFPEENLNIVEKKQENKKLWRQQEFLYLNI